MKKFFLSIALIAGVVLYAGAQHISAPNKIANAARIIDRYYVDNVNIDSLVEQAIISMLHDLDPHSQYSNAEETQALTEPLEGNFSGVGISFNMTADTLYVIETVADGPCQRAGVLAGDRIITVNDTIIAGVKMSNKDIMKRLRGPKGTKVKIGIKRGSGPELIEFVITRDNIPINSVGAVYMVQPEVGFIEITRFAEKTPQEFQEALKKLKKKGMRHLIIDLTSNGGGYLTSATDIAQLFVPRDSTIVSTKGENFSEKRYINPGNPDPEIDRLVVMVDRYTASASEILAGAIQDFDRGVIVGRRTFAKGLVQRPFPFADGSMIRLTIARYYTPSGRCIQKPYQKGQDEQYFSDIYDRYAAGELTSADSIHLDPDQQFTTLISHRPVYGGGGIMPDVFVPADTTAYSTYLRDLIAKGVIQKYAIGYVDANRKAIKKQYRTREAFAEKFKVSEEMLTDFKQLALADSVKFDAEGYARSYNLICTNIKALIGRDVYDFDTSRIIFNPSDEIFRKALEVIIDPEKYNSLLQAPANQ